MDSSINSNEVIHTNTLSCYNLPNINDIKKEICDDSTSRLDKYDDFAFEPFHQNIFRTLSSNFDNQSNIDQINEAYLKLESCFIENNILNKNGETKLNIKGLSDSTMFLKYRDIDDAFIDMVISESNDKLINSKYSLKKIDFKSFKDTFFSLDSNESQNTDYEDIQSRTGYSDSEGIDESESHIEFSHSENGATDSDFSDTNENDIHGETDLFGFDNTEVSAGLAKHIKIENLTGINPKNIDDSEYPLPEDNKKIPFTGPIKNLRIVVEKLSCELTEQNDNAEEDNDIQEIVSSPKPHSNEIRQVARKKTGGLVLNRNVPLNSEEDKNVFDKMTRAAKRDLERVLAESTANLVIQKTSQLISEKLQELQTNEKYLESSSSEDEFRESEIHKTAELVTKTIYEFLAKSKCKKQNKLGKDTSEELSNKLVSLNFSNMDGNDVKESTAVISTSSSVKPNSSVENKVDKNLEIPAVKSSETNEETNSKKVIQENVRPNPPKKKLTRRNALSVNSNKTLAEQFEEIARIERDIINCELTTPLDVDEHEEPRRPITRQSYSKTEKDLVMNDENNQAKRPSTRLSVANTEKDILIEDERDGPKRPLTRQTLAKLDKDNILIDEEREEIKKYPTRLSLGKTEKDTNSELNKPIFEEKRDEPRRPTTRQSLQKQKEIIKNSSDNILPRDELKTTADAPKRKVNPKVKQTATRRSLRKQNAYNIKNIVTALADETLSESFSERDFVFNEDSVQSLNASDVSQSSKIDDTPVFSHSTILKASADSTTSENGPNETNINNIDGDNVQDNRSSVNNGREQAKIIITEKINANSNCTSVNMANSDVQVGENTSEVHSQSNNKESGAVTNSVGGKLVASTNGNNLKKINSIENKESQNLTGVSKLIEDVLDETMKENVILSSDLSQDHIDSSMIVTSPARKCANEMSKNESTHKVASHFTDEPFQILNDMITDIEENLLKEENKVTKTVSGTKDVVAEGLDKSFTPTEDSNADSTSFLNYSMDDSFKLIIDESTPNKKVTLENSISTMPSLLSPDEEKSNLSKQNNETNCEDGLKTSNLINKEKEQTKNKDMNTSVEENDKKLYEDPKRKEKSVEDKAVNNQNPENNKSAIEGENPPASLDSKSFTGQKPLTNEEKIAQLTKRDPRLVNEKKIVNVLLRDPRLRNKLPKIDEKRENSLTEKDSDSKPLEKKTELETLEQESFSSKPCEQKSNEPKPSEQKSNESKPSEHSEEKTNYSKLSETEASDSPRSPDPETAHPANSSQPATLQESGIKSSLRNDQTTKSEVFDANSEQNRKKKVKKAVDEELLYKTPLSDLHDTHSDRPTYDRASKKKRTAPPSRKTREVNEEPERPPPGSRRSRGFEELNGDRRGYNQKTHVGGQPSGAFFRHDSYEERNFLLNNEEGGSEPHHRPEGRFYGKEGVLHNERKFYQEEREAMFPSETRENFEQEGFARRDGNYGGAPHDRNDFQDNHIYSRREFYRRDRFAHDHDHFGNSSRLMNNSNNSRQENQFYPQQNNFAVSDESVFRISAYPPVSMLPDPMYSQEQDFDQSYGNMMDNDSFSPPSLDLCPPPPLIRSPSPELLRRDNYCPSPPRIGRCGSPNERVYEEHNRTFHRNYENDERSFRGRSNGNNRIHQRGGRRGVGRDYHRWREESPPRKRFAGEFNRGREDDRGRWRRSPSWSSPDRARRWSRERSLSPSREQHPWNSPREVHPWNSPRDHPWNSPRARSPSPPRRRDNYRDRSSYYHRY